MRHQVPGAQGADDKLNPGDLIEDLCSGDEVADIQEDKTDKEG